MNDFIYTSHHFTTRGDMNSLNSLCGFIAQLVEHRTGIAEVMGSNPVEALIFSGFFFPVALIGKFTAMITLARGEKMYNLNPSSHAQTNSRFI